MEIVLSAVLEHGLILACLFSVLLAFVSHLMLRYSSNDDGTGAYSPDPVIVRNMTLPVLILAWFSLALTYLFPISIPESAEMHPFLFWSFFGTALAATPVMAGSAIWSLIRSGSEIAAKIGHFTGMALAGVWAAASFLNFAFLLISVVTNR